MKKFSLKTRGRSQPIWKTKRFLLPLIGLLAIGVLLPSVFNMAGAALMYPIHITRVWFQDSTDSLPLYIRERGELINEIASLEQALSGLSGARLSIERLQDENDRLRELVGLAAVPDKVTGRVIARPDQLPYDVLQIDIGSLDGVALHAPVFKGVDQVIGFTSYVSDRYSLVTLVTSPHQRSTVYVVGPDVYAVAEGMGGGILRVRVPQGISLAVDDLVILPAVDVGVFGAITHVETAPTQPQQYGYVPLAASLQSIRYITVGQSPIEAVDFTTAAGRVSETVTNLFQVEVPAELQVATSSIATSSADTFDDSNQIDQE